MHPGMQATQAQQRIGVRCGHVRQLAQFTHHADQGIELNGFARLHILQHGGFKGS